MLQITVHTSSGRPIEKIATDIADGVTLGGRKGMTQVARSLTQALKTEAPFWRRNLYESIKSRTLSENEIGVFMNFYGTMLESGHRITKITPQFMEWIFEKAKGNPFLFARALLAKGHTDANPWITRALTRVEGRFGKEVLEAIRTELKRRGFR